MEEREKQSGRKHRKKDLENKRSKLWFSFLNPKHYAGTSSLPTPSYSQLISSTTPCPIVSKDKTWGGGG
jgi:hypothetical protein